MAVLYVFAGDSLGDSQSNKASPFPISQPRPIFYFHAPKAVPPLLSHRVGEKVKGIKVGGTIVKVFVFLLFEPTG